MRGFRLVDYGLGGVVLLAGLIGCGDPMVGAAEGIASGEGDEEVVAVDAFVPERTELQRTTTQPATVHAWNEARVVAKVSGYLDELRADIGKQVKAGDVLAVLDLPELVGQRRTKLASIARLHADEQHAEAEMAVAEAAIATYEAKVEQARANLGKATAQLKAAQVELERVGDLVGQRAVADMLLDETQARFEAAQAEQVAADAAIKASEAELQLKRAQVQAANAMRDMARAMIEVARRELEELDVLLQYAHLTSPFDGVVSQRNADLGDLVRNAQSASSRSDSPLFVIVHLDKVRVRVMVPERDAPLVNVGDPVCITLQALPGETIEGEVSRCAGVMDERTRTMLVEIDLPNDERKFLPGMFGEATIVLEQARDRVVLPSGAIRYDEQGKSYVYTVNKGSEIDVVEVTTGLDDGKQVEIVTGLDGNERVVGAVLRRLAEGQKVAVTTESL